MRAILDSQALPHSLQRALRASPSRAIERADLLRLGVVEQAEHVTADARVAGLGDVQAGRDGDGGICAVAAFAQDLEAAGIGERLGGGDDAFGGVDGGAP